MGKHDPFEVFRDRLTAARAIYFWDCGIGDGPLERRFRFEHPNSLFCVTKLARCDINDEWTKIEDLVNSDIDSGDCLARSGIFSS